jgi:hypothetical protein
VKLVHLVGFIIKQFVTMHGHMNVKKKTVLLLTVISIACYVCMCVSVFCLSCSTRNAHAPYYIFICGLSGSTIFLHITS